MIRDNHWYNNNEQRPWPFDDLATLQDDQGQMLPSNLLADLKLTFPTTYGERAYLSGIYAGPAAVGLVLVSDNGTTLATFSQSRPIETGRVYRLTSQSAGATGWVVFGSYLDAEDQQLNLRFSTSAQSLLLPNTAKSYRPPAVTSLGKLNADAALTGLVKLSAGTDIQITKETVAVNGEDTEVVLFSLRNDQDDASRNLSELYAGPCGARPESQNCGDPQPITAINTVTPDCCGTIYIELRGCGEISRVQNDTLGVILDCGFSLADACVTPKHLPDASGRLPNEYEDACDGDYEPGSETPSYGFLRSLDVTTSTTVSPGGGSGACDPPVFTANGSLPWSESFEDGDDEEFVFVLFGVPPGSANESEYNVIPGQGSSGYSRGGEIDIIIPDTTATNSTVVFQNAHGLSVGDRLVISDPEDAAYEGEHTVVSAPTSHLVVISTPYTADSEGGVWFKANGASSPTVGGGCAGTVSVAQDNGGDLQLIFNQTHLLEVGHLVAVAGSGEATYNASHTVASIDSAVMVTTGTAYAADAFGGFFVRQLAGSAGRVVSAESSGTGYHLIETSAAHGLEVGDIVIVLQNSAAGANRQHRVTTVVDTTHFITDVLHDSDGTGGLWLLVDGPNTAGYNYQSRVVPHSLAAWNGAIPNASSWSGRFIEAETTFTIPTGSGGDSHNGGLFFNLVDSTNFFLAELSFDSSKRLLLWQVNQGAFSLVAETAVPTAQPDRRYRLTVTIDQCSAVDVSGLLKVNLTGLDDGLSATLGPNLRVPSFPTSGRNVGFHAHYSGTVFEYLTVRNLER